MAVPPVIVMAMGAPWLLSWPSPVVLVAMPPCSSLWSCGAPAIIAVVGPPPDRPCGRVVPPAHPHGCVDPPWVVVMAMWCLVAIGALEAMGVPPLIPWCPTWPLVLPSHHGGHVGAMWCPLVVLVAVWCPHLSLCGTSPVIVVAVWCLMAIGALPCSSSSLWVPSRPWVSPHLSPGAPLGCWCSPVIVMAMSWPCGALPVVQAVWCPSC